MVRGQRSGTKIGIGDVVKTYIVRVDVARRELDLAISQLIGRAQGRHRRINRPRQRRWPRKKAKTRKGQGPRPARPPRRAAGGKAPRVSTRGKRRWEDEGDGERSFVGSVLEGVVRASKGLGVGLGFRGIWCYYFQPRNIMVASSLVDSIFSNNSSLDDLRLRVH